MTVWPRPRSLPGRSAFTGLTGLVRPDHLPSVGLLVVLVALPGFALWGATATNEAGMAAIRATRLKGFYEEARYAVAAEESLERKYRLEPSSQVRALHEAAGAEMVAALERAADLGHAADRQLTWSVLAKHRQYTEAISRMFAAVDAHDVEAATAIDGSEVDPSFDEIVSAVAAVSDRNRALAAERLDALTDIQSRVLVATPVIFGFGVALVAVFWRLLRTYQHRMEESLEREAFIAHRGERRFRGMVLNTSDLILVCAGSGTITYRSPAAETAWGYAVDKLLGEQIAHLAHPDDKAAFRSLWQQLRPQVDPGDGQDATGRIELRLRDGAGVWRHAELLATNLLHDTAVQGLVVTIRDITERKAFEQQLTRQAFYDPLTGLPNRFLFLDRLQRALVRAGQCADPVGLLFIDLDKFKLINDSLGHQVGDELLIEAAGRLRACVGAHDTLARLSGDEFVIVRELLAGEADATCLATAITHQFSRPFMMRGREIVVSASIGIAIGEAGRDDAENLVRDADAAMYRAKSNGVGLFTMFDPGMHTDTLARLELETELRQALARQELRVHYQPIVSIASGELSEFEALVRWQHPTRGLVSPGDFISIAEETGLIIPLGMWVLEAACRQVTAWHERFPARPWLKLGVNLSPRQFQQASLVEDVAAALRNSGLPAHCLKLEITENVIMQDAEATIRTLWELKALGLQLAVDDFGTGYSSLAYLKRLPLDVVKIDRTFVSGIGQNQEDAAIVHAILALARSLNLMVTGEGIETVEQANLLAEWGCDHGQGYLFSRPLDGEAAGALLDNGTHWDRARVPATKATALSDPL